MNNSKSRLQQALDAFDQANSADPNQHIWQGKEWPKQLLEAQRISAWVQKLAPKAAEALVLAARCQHICRWQVPRSSYPAGRVGYLQWRHEMGKFHADTAAKILSDVGYDAPTIARVSFLNRKKQLKTDPDTQTLEDALALVFLEWQFADFALLHSDEKVIDILRKTWAKMSPKGHEAALGLSLPKAAAALLQKALSSDETP